MRSNKSHITSYLFDREINLNKSKKPDLGSLFDTEIELLPLAEIFNLREKERLQLIANIIGGRIDVLGGNCNIVIEKLNRLIKNKIMSLTEFAQLGSEQQRVVIGNSKLIGILVKDIKISFNQLVKLSLVELNEVLDRVGKIDRFPLANSEIIDIQNDIIKRTTSKTHKI